MGEGEEELEFVPHIHMNCVSCLLSRRLYFVVRATRVLEMSLAPGRLVSFADFEAPERDSSPTPHPPHKTKKGPRQKPRSQSK